MATAMAGTGAADNNRTTLITTTAPTPPLQRSPAPPTSLPVPNSNKNSATKNMAASSTTAPTELFQAEHHTMPWWRARLFVSEPVLFGTWDGVFSTVALSIVSVIVYVRSGWMVAQAGIGGAMLIVVLSILIALATAFSAIGVCRRSRLDGGGIYTLTSTVLGAQTSGTVAILYCLGQAASCAIQMAGFGESVAYFFGDEYQHNQTLVKSVAVLALLATFVVNIMGVEWIIRVQLLLLAVMGASLVDFYVGSLARIRGGGDVDFHSEFTAMPKSGVVGFSTWLWQNNTMPDYTQGENFFTVFSVFFPTIIGVLAGLNMSGDLRDPYKSIPRGTLSGIGAAFVVYTSFVLILGATCTRAALLSDYLIAEKVSLLGIVFSMGVCVVSLSSALGAGVPHIMQKLGEERVLPVFIGAWISKGKGANNNPINALIVFTILSVVFVLTGRINELAQIVTLPMLLTYAVVDYSYFCLAMTFTMEREAQSRAHARRLQQALRDGRIATPPERGGGGFTNLGGVGGRSGASSTFDADLDRLFPERKKVRDAPITATATTGSADAQQQHKGVRQYGSVPRSESNVSEIIGYDDITSLVPNEQEQVLAKPHDWFFSICCNRWISLVAAFIKIIICFLVHWLYALIVLATLVGLRYYIGLSNPKLGEGVASQFNFLKWLGNVVRHGQLVPELDVEHQHIVVVPSATTSSGGAGGSSGGIAPSLSAGDITRASAQNERGTDFQDRHLYHQQQMVGGGEGARTAS